MQLRIYEPLAAHPEYEDFPVSDNRDVIESLIAHDADERLISLPPNPVADSYRSTPIFLPAELTDDGIDRVCPAQDDIRSWHALDALIEGTSKYELDIVAPKKARRSAHSRRVEWLQEEPDTRVFTRTSTWDVPPVWWLAVNPHEDDEEIIATPTPAGSGDAEVRRENAGAGRDDAGAGGGNAGAADTHREGVGAGGEDAAGAGSAESAGRAESAGDADVNAADAQARGAEAGAQAGADEDGDVPAQPLELATVRHRFRVPLFTAAARVEWAYDVMKDKSRLPAIIESTENLVEWFKTFDVNSVVELDLGGLSEVIQFEQAADLVGDWIDALDADDMESAIAAFREYSRLWETMVLFSRGS